MLPDLLATLIGISLVCFPVLDGATLQAHGTLVLIGAVLALIGLWANRVDYLKWPGAVVVIAGLAILILVLSGLAASSAEAAFWVVFWSGNAVGITSLWSALYRGPKVPPPEPSL